VLYHIGNKVGSVWTLTSQIGKNRWR